MNYKTEYGLPNSLKGKSFAEASKHLENKFKERNSIFDINTKKELLSRLKDVQEMQRQKLEAKRQKVEGQNQMYTGGPLYPIGIDTDISNYWNQNRGGSMYDLPATGTIESRNSSLPFNAMNAGQINLEHNINNVSSDPNWWDKTKSYMNGEKGQSLLGGVGLAISGLAPMIANRNAMKSLTKAKTVNPMLMNPNQVQANFVNRQQLMRNMNEQASSQRYNMSQTGGNWGQYSQALAGLNSGLISSTGNLMLQSDLADSAEKVRVQQGRQGIQQFNIGQRQRADKINAQNQAAYTNQMAAYRQAQGANIGAIGSSLFNYITAKKVAKSAGSAYGFDAINPNGQQ